jgi:hypothetical protein
MGLVLMMDWIHFLFDFSFVDFGLMGVVWLWRLLCYKTDKANQKIVKEDSITTEPHHDHSFSRITELESFEHSFFNCRLFNNYS